MVGEAATASDAVEVFPVTPLAAVTVTLLLTTPAVEAVTFTDKVHDADAARVTPARLTTLPDAPGVPPQVEVKPLAPATANPEVRVSVNPTPVSVVTLDGLEMLKFSEVVPPGKTLAAPKLLVMLGAGAEFTVVLMGPIVLFAVLGSNVGDITVAVLVTLVPLFTVTTIAMVAELPLVTVPRLQLTAEVPLQVPWLGVAETKLVFAGRVSFTTTLSASFGPLSVTVML
jgi:hypothetical protein